MKISFPNCGSGIGISIRAAINSLLNRQKAERTKIATREKNVPQITPGWDYRPRESVRRHAAADAARAETSDILSPDRFAIDHNVWFNNDSFEYAAHTFDSDPAIGDARTKAPSRDRAYAGSGYD
jgi:hypothetical protein